MCLNLLFVFISARYMGGQDARLAIQLHLLPALKLSNHVRFISIYKYVCVMCVYLYIDCVRGA